ncbi:lysophospholipid acyltransferase family protein [Balneola sp. MJW-20]|uniref:lysophospholipid acyltransferase family protein n=1 Tax=Gracilimonas aurantiaca TaxID=3234185 RepID=UPI0034677BE6
MLSRIFSFFAWIWFCVLFLIFFFLIAVTFLITFPFDKYRKAPNYVLSYLGLGLIRTSPGWKIEMDGLDKYDRGTPTIFIANHQSFLDMALLYQLPWQMKWVSKRSLAFIPIMGWMVWLTGQLTINRTSKSAIRKLDNLVQPLKDGIPVMIFPEGTRSLDGKMKHFKNGAFLLAKEHNFMLQPMVIDGGYKAMPSGSKVLNPKASFRVRVMDPIDPTKFNDMRSLKDHCHAIMEKELKEIRSN